MLQTVVDFRRLLGDRRTVKLLWFHLMPYPELPEDFTGDDLAAVATSANLALAESTGVYSRAG